MSRIVDLNNCILHIPKKQKTMSKYNATVVIALMKQAYKIPEPKLEYRFYPLRKWRFDFAWPVVREPQGITGENSGALAIEIQGGMFTQGRHTRGGALRKEWEKLNMAAILGWRILYFQPDDIYKKATMEMIQRALGI